MICCICKISLYKTEKCNGMSHHNLERCYACGRIGFKIRGLHEHWNTNGVNGCFRFDTDLFIKENIPSFMCSEDLCTNHDKGDCITPQHQHGIQQLEKLRKKAYVYHMLKSLMPPFCLQVFDVLIQKYANVPTFMEYIPFKQSLVLVHHFKHRYKDYLEDIVYEQLNCKMPINMFCKNEFIKAEDYVVLHKKHLLIEFSDNGYDMEFEVENRLLTTPLLPRIEVGEEVDVEQFVDRLMIQLYDEID